MTKRQPPRGDIQPDLFVATFADIPIRDQQDTMERPFFSLAKKPRLTPIKYQVGEVRVEVTANPNFGMATIWDADVLIWACTQLTEAIDRGQEPNRKIKFHHHNLLKAVRRSSSCRDYARLRAALERLTHTAVRTNIRSGATKKHASFHWLESWTESIDETAKETQGMTLTLPDWLYQGVIQKGGVLTIHEDYFLLTGGIERWLYRVARKHAGRQPQGWSFTMRQLYEKSGSLARFSDFALDIRKVAEQDTLPEYVASIRHNEEGAEVVHFIPRTALAVTDPRAEWPRFPGRRMTTGIRGPAIRPSALAGEGKDTDPTGPLLSCY